MKIALYAVIAFCLSCCGSARAMNLYTYDLDSLAYMSSDVVEADIVGPQPNQDSEIVQVRVTDVRKGHFVIGALPISQRRASRERRARLRDPALAAKLKLTSDAIALCCL